jgi:hypothetical protein
VRTEELVEQADGVDDAGEKDEDLANEGAERAGWYS